MGRIIMGYWDCKQCDTKHIAGSDRECPNCGRPRPESTKFYMDNNSVHVDDQTERIVRARGRDWVCEYCNSLNSGLETRCPSCGASKVENKNNTEYVSYESSSVKHHEPDTSSHNDFDNPRINPRICSTNNICTAEKVRSIFNTLKIPGIIAGALIVCFLIIFALIPKGVEFTISDIYWESNIDIEQLTPVDESDWTMPPGATLRYKQMEIHHYDQVPDGYDTITDQEIDYWETKVIGYKDLGNGYFEEITDTIPHYKTVTKQVPKYKDEPVMQMKYYYTIYKWLHYRYVTASAHDKSPYYNDAILSDNEREKSRHTDYYISGFDTEDKKHTYHVDNAFWANCQIGDYVKGKADITGHFKPDTEKEQ